jgi:hypothetical protein
MRYSILALLAAGALAAPAHAAAPNMKEGLWEITTKTEMAGMPQGMKPQVVRQCITKKDLEDPRKTTPGGDPKDGRCQVTDHKQQGNTSTWNMACKGEGAMTGSGTATYNGTSYTGSSKMTMTRGGQAHTMTVHYSAKHLGECKN